jgi:hypothetical protein
VQTLPTPVAESSPISTPAVNLQPQQSADGLGGAPSVSGQNVLGGGAIAGIVIACILGVAVIAAILYVVLTGRKRGRKDGPVTALVSLSDGASSARGSPKKNKKEESESESTTSSEEDEEEDDESESDGAEEEDEEDSEQ